MTYSKVSLNYAERQWLVSNMTKDVWGTAERGLVLGLYLTNPKVGEGDYSIEVELNEEQLWILDKLISSNAPFTTSLSSGERLYTLGEKVWYHLALLHCPIPLFRPKEALDAADNTDTDDNPDTDTLSAEYETVRRSEYY